MFESVFNMYISEGMLTFAAYICHICRQYINQVSLHMQQLFVSGTAQVLLTRDCQNIF